MYRPDITVVDCSIRDGGLLNDSQFSFELVQEVYNGVCQSGVQIIELGYRNSSEHFSPDKYGAWRFCDDEIIKKVVGKKKYPTKVAVMMDAHKSDPNDIKPKKESAIDIFRIATYVKDIDKAIKLANVAHENGYDSCINIMAISHVIEMELDEALRQIQAETKIKACYIVDSFGALYSEHIDFYMEKYKRILKDIEIGVHCHNNQQLAFANTIQGVIKGANYLDATLFGMGRGAGNCPLELLLGFLKNPKFDLRPILDIISKHIIEFSKQESWGYHVPYMITGILNQHPQEAIKMVNLPDDNKLKNSYTEFYEKCMEAGEY